VPFVSVIVPTARRPERMHKLLSSLAALDYPAFEIVIVDNAPDDPRTRQEIEAFAARDPRVRYMNEPLPGSSVARNRGIAEVDSELLAFTDDDVEVDPQWLSWIVERFLADPRVDVVTGLVLPANLDTPEQRWFEEFSGFGKGFDLALYDTDEHRAEDRPLYPYWGGVFGSGNNMAYRRRVLLEIGGLDPALGAGSPALAGADIEAFSHAILRGSRLAYEPRALCWHDHRATPAAVSKQTFSYAVGVTAILTKWLLRDPRLWLQAGRQAASLAAGMLPRFATPSTASSHEISRLSLQLKMNRERGALRRQLAGFALGPAYYARSVLWARRLRLRAVLPARDHADA
jgi:GT2 family glycosyltransferase